MIKLTRNEIAEAVASLGLDPKGAAGALKTPLHLIPPVAKAAQARVHKLGEEKYGPWNWRANKVCLSTYLGAMLRHIDAVIDGVDVDEESGEAHLAHVATSCNIVLDALAHGMLVDDRVNPISLCPTHEPQSK